MERFADRFWQGGGMEEGNEGGGRAPRAATDGVELAPYMPPTLTVVGSVYELTLTGGGHGCFFGKKWGGSDGLEYMQIQIPVSSC
jgi:hypothetical protein